MKDAMSGTTDILFAGDVHGRFDHLITAVRDYRPRALVLLGDLEAPEPLTAMMAPLEALGTDVWFIPGNHDTDTAASWQHLEDRADRNLHGRVVTIAGVRIAGLGGVFREEIWDPTQEARYSSYADYLARAQPRRTFRPGAEEASQKAAGRLLKHRSSIFPDVYEGLLANTADILVTHEAPSCHPYGFTAIDKLARALGVTRLFHGHHHDGRDYRVFEGVLGFRAFGVGLRGLSDSEGHLVRPGERAPARGQKT